MGKHANTKRLSSTSNTASKAIDLKARKRIEELYELTDEIIDAYNEVNEAYVNKIYRKYKQLQDTNKKLKSQLSHHHCRGCNCTIPSNEDAQCDEEDEAEEYDDEDVTSSSSDECVKRKPRLASSVTSKTPVTTRRTRQNPFIISDIEDTPNSDGNDSRLNQNYHDIVNNDRISMTTNENEIVQEKIQSGNEDTDVTKNSNQNIEEDEGMTSLPSLLQDIIRKKAIKNKNAKAYLLQIPRYPALCEYLRDRSRTSFDHRPSESQVRPLISNHLSQQMASDSKVRMRLRDELREIHRSYMRTFMNDPHANASKVSFHKVKRLSLKKSPM